jgi:DNA-binding transcriptional LysR family regulator
MNWDDLKYFLAVARNGSVRGAAQALDVNHATVSRRIRHFEEALGQRLFDRTPSGYEKTHFAEQIYRDALHLEERLYAVTRKLAGQDQKLSGEIRLTLHDGLLQQFLMDDFAVFCEQYPDIELEILDSSRTLNLANREADIALRFSMDPPDYLVGRKAAEVYRACYVAADKIDEYDPKTASWIGWSDSQRRPIGKIAKEYPKLDSRHKIMNANLQLSACRAGMGVGILPCFLGDADPQLVRIPPHTAEHKFDLWLLYHPDLRKNSKIQTFVQFLYERFDAHKDLFEGRFEKQN